MSNDKLAATGYEPPSQETVCDRHKEQYFYSGYEAGKKECRAGKGQGEECTCKRPAVATVTPDPPYGVALAWHPQGRPGQKPEELGLDEWIGQALGAASSCWSDLESAGAFDSTRCGEVAKALTAHISGLFAAFVKEAEVRRKMSDAYISGQGRRRAEASAKQNTVPCPDPRNCGDDTPHDAHLSSSFRKEAEEGPRLGLATTRQLLEELKARAITAQAMDVAVLRNGPQNMKEVLSQETLDYRTVGL